MLPGRRLHQAPIHRVPHVERQQLFEEGVGIGTEDVVGPAGAPLGGRHREQSRGRRRRAEGAEKLAVHHVQRGQPPRLVVGHQACDEVSRQFGRRIVPDIGALGLDRPLDILEIPRALLADGMKFHRVALRLERLDPAPGFLDQVGIEGPRQPAVGRHQDQPRRGRPALGRGRRLAQQREPLGQLRRHQVRDHAAQRLRIGAGGHHPIRRALQLGRGHQLHRPGDLAGVLDRPDPAQELASLRHYSGRNSGLKVAMAALRLAVRSSLSAFFVRMSSSTFDAWASR